MLAFSMRKFFWGLLIISVGGLIWASNFGYISLSFRFSRDWPVVIVGIGLMSVWDALFGRHWWGGKFCCQPRAKRDNIAKVLADLEKGEIDAAEAVKRMEKK